MKHIEIVEDFDPGVALEYSAELYPASGIYYIGRSGHLVAVSKEANLATFLDSRLMTVTKTTEVSVGSGGVGVSDLARLLAVALHPQAAVAEVAR